MRKSRSRYLRLTILGAAVAAAILVASLACAAEATPTPAPTAPPGPIASPTPVPVMPTPTPVVTGKPVYGGTLRYYATPLDQNTSWDPVYTKVWEEYWPEFLFYNTLVRLGVDGAAQPELARSWEISADGKTITFHLVQGAKFHDGTFFSMLRPSSGTWTATWTLRWALSRSSTSSPLTELRWWTPTLLPFASLNRGVLSWLPSRRGRV